MINKGLIILMLLFFLMACSEGERSIALKFVPVYGEQAFGCNDSIDIEGVSWSYSQLQFFVSQVQLQDHQGQWQSIALAKTDVQTEQVALLGLNCQNGEQGSWQLHLETPIELTQYQKLRFAFGVPFELNHQNPLTQESPLNLSSMFWVWQTGHKFLRLEMETSKDQWLFHLGSTGCQSPSVMRAPDNVCRNPNLFTMEVSLTSDTVHFDLAPLITGLSLSSQSHCQSEHDSPSCQILMNNLKTRNKDELFKGSRSE